MNWWKPLPLLGKLVILVIALFLGMQLIPYGRAHKNPLVTAEPEWHSPRIRKLFMRACADCHSNQTTWPWYAGIAPVSWLITRDVNHGREHFNISEWNLDRKQDGDKAAETLRNGEMPIWLYVPFHPEAKLSEAEKQELIEGLVIMFGDGEQN